MFSKTFSLITRREIGYLATGAFYLLYSLLEFANGGIFKLIQIFSMLAAIICMILTHALKYEEDDEMSIKHINEAQSIALNVTVGVIMLISLYINLCWFLNKYLNLSMPTNVPVAVWTWFVVGIAYITTGTFFLKFEKHSECLE